MSKIAWNVKHCIRCDQEKDHAKDDYMCVECRFNTDHRFTRDEHTVTFSVGHQGSLGVQVECPNGTIMDESAPCWMRGENLYGRCLVAHLMHENGPNPMDLLTDPHNGDYEIQGPLTPIEWYYNVSKGYEGDYDCEFGWRIADGPPQPVE